MANNVLKQLTDMQCTCLRMVALNRSSKEIALETGLSYQTVDQYISRAAAVLGASNRREAARRFSELEAEQFRKPEFKADSVVLPAESRILSEPIGNPGTRRDRKSLLRWIPGIGGTRHDLDPIQIIYTVLRISLLTMGSAGAIIATVFWLNRLLL